jgi:hypothetical protein
MTRLLEGSIDTRRLPGLILSLQTTAQSGRLRVERDGVTRDLYLRSGWLVAADSSAETDSLEWLLYTAGSISDDRHSEVRALIRNGARRGRALVESGCLTPHMLCEWTERRVGFLASDVLSWTSGSYSFERDTNPPDGSIGVTLSPLKIVLGKLRDGSQGKMPDFIGSSLPASDRLLERAPAADQAAGLLLPHEAYVLSLVNGRRPVSEICHLSETGEAETLKALALLTVAGCAMEAGTKGLAVQDEARRVEPLPSPAAAASSDLSPAGLPEGDTTDQLRAVVRIYNDLYTFLYGYMFKEIGPIAEQLLEKNLGEVREGNPRVFSRVQANRDGTLYEDLLSRNINLIKSPDRREILVAGLNEYLQALVSAVRRILGPEHQERVVRRLREMRCTRI